MENKVYYIYEIVGVKVGCTNNFERRQYEQRKKGKMILLETHTDLHTASIREKELQIEKGYPTDGTDYIFALKRQQLGVEASNTPEAIKKSSEARKGKPMPWMHTKEARKIKGKKTYERQVGKKPTQMLTSEAIKKSALSRKGKKLTWLQTPEVRQRADAKRKIPVDQYSKDGTFIKRWLSGTDADRVLGINNANINSCCRGKVKSTGGYVWKYADKKNRI